jgi:hypothetical protein
LAKRKSAPTIQLSRLLRPHGLGEPKVSEGILTAAVLVENKVQPTDRQCFA